MAETNNMKLPSRSYWDGFKARNEALWDKVRGNTYVNMFFPVEDLAEGNTLAVATSVIPGKQAITTAGKTIFGQLDEVVKPARKVVRPGAKKAANFIEDGIEYTSYGSSLPGTPLYFSVPKSEVTRGKPQWIPTHEEVVEALATHFKNAKEAVREGIQDMANRTANYRAMVQKMDRKLSRIKDSWDAKRSMYLTKARTGQIAKSDLPKVTLYLEEELASLFTPSAKAFKKGSFDIARKEWMDKLAELGYDITTKESIAAADQIFLNNWGKKFPINKFGGKINYLSMFN